MNEPVKYPNDTPPEQIEKLIEGAADLQKQILRRYTQSILEEMQYHLFIAQEKCRMFEETCATLREELEQSRNAAKRWATQAALPREPTK